jgi:hypothetical protein
MKAYGGVDVEIDIFLTSTLGGGERPASQTGHFTPAERAVGIHWIGGWMDPRASLDDKEKCNFFTPTGLEFRPFGPLAVAIPTVLSRLKSSANPVTNPNPASSHENRDSVLEVYSYF